MGAHTVGQFVQSSQMYKYWWNRGGTLILQQRVLQNYDCYSRLHHKKPRQCKNFYNIYNVHNVHGQIYNLLMLIMNSHLKQLYDSNGNSRKGNPNGDTFVLIGDRTGNPANTRWYTRGQGWRQGSGPWHWRRSIESCWDGGIGQAIPPYFKKNGLSWSEAKMQCFYGPNFDIFRQVPRVSS